MHRFKVSPVQSRYKKKAKVGCPAGVVKGRIDDTGSARREGGEEEIKQTVSDRSIMGRTDGWMDGQAGDGCLVSRHGPTITKDFERRDSEGPLCGPISATGQVSEQRTP